VLTLSRLIGSLEIQRIGSETSWMKTTGINLIAVAACVLCLSSAKAGVIADWNFNSLGSGTPPSSINADTFNSSLVNATPSITATAAGQVSLARYSPGAGSSGYALEWTSASHGNQLGTAANASFIIQLKAISTLSSLAVNFNGLYTGGTALASYWSYNINTGTVGTYSTPVTENLSSTWASTPYNPFSGLTLTSGQTLDIQVTFSAGGNPAGIAFDDVVITAVPEPINYALACFGLLFVGGSIGRFYLVRGRA